MNGYIGFWNGVRQEIMANTSYEAQKKLVPVFQVGTRKKVKGYDISVSLVEKDGEQITHTAVD